MFLLALFLFNYGIIMFYYIHIIILFQAWSHLLCQWQEGGYSNCHQNRIQSHSWKKSCIQVQPSRTGYKMLHEICLNGPQESR